MPKTAVRILKADDTKLEGQFHLGIAQAGPTPSNNKNAALSTPQANIIEKQPEFTVIEVTCSCGTKTYLRCEYADEQAPEAKQT